MPWKDIFLFICLFVFITYVLFIPSTNRLFSFFSLCLSSFALSLLHLSIWALGNRQIGDRCSLALWFAKWGCLSSSWKSSSSSKIASFCILDSISSRPRLDHLHYRHLLQEKNHDHIAPHWLLMHFLSSFVHHLHFH